MKGYWCNELVGWFWSPFKWDVRCVPTSNKQCVIEEEKTEVSGVFIEPVLKCRRGTLRSVPYAVWGKWTFIQLSLLCNMHHAKAVFLNFCQVWYFVYDILGWPGESSLVSFLRVTGWGEELVRCKVSQVESTELLVGNTNF